MKCVAVLTTLLLGVSVTFATFPNEFKHCDRTDENVNECLSDAITDAIKKLSEPKYGLPDFEPLTLEHIIAWKSRHSGLIFNTEFFNYEIHGITKSNFTTEAKLSRCDDHPLSPPFDIEKCHKLQILLSFPKLEHKFRCKFYGDVDDHSVRGEGSGSAVTINTRIFYIFQFYGYPYFHDLQIIDDEMGTRDEVVYNFDTFEGDMTAEELTQFVNNISREFFHLTMEGFLEIFNRDHLVKSLLNFFSKVSVDELW